VTINSISFFNGAGGAAVFETADYTFTFSTSTFTVNNLNTADLDANPGADAALFASLNLSGATGAKFSITAGTGGGTAFMYDPSAGDLLVDIARANVIVGSGSWGLAAMSGSSGGLFSRAHNYDGGFNNFGLVTEFDIEPKAVSEPGTLALLGIGMAGLGFAAGRRRAA
jgi:hypothetical protein